MRWQFIDDRKFYLVAAHVFDAREAYMLPVTELVELARLRAQDAAEVMRRLALHDGAATGELVDEEAPAHRSILA
jgi:hypothetical protein